MFLICNVNETEFTPAVGINHPWSKAMLEELFKMSTACWKWNKVILYLDYMNYLIHF